MTPVTVLRRMTRFSRSPGAGLAALAALLFLFVTAEVFDVVHTLDFKAHQNGEPCKICLSMASLGSASVGQTQVTIAEHTVAPFVMLRPKVLLSAELPRPAARGPPAAS